jgi:hypothetical protein
MTVSRYVYGYTKDTARPGIKVDTEFDLTDMGGYRMASTYGAGSVPAATGLLGVTSAEYGDGIVHQTVITLTAALVTMTDAGAAGNQGGIQIYDFPQGVTSILGASSNLTTLAGAGGIGDTAALVGSVGTVVAATDNATLTTTEADIIPSTAGTLTAGAGTLNGKSTTPAVFDGTATAKSAFLNLAVPDAGSSASDTVAVTGTVTITWINHGDS